MFQGNCVGMLLFNPKLEQSLELSQASSKRILVSTLPETFSIIRDLKNYCLDKCLVMRYNASFITGVTVVT